jgi:hypothetical protein
VPTPPALIRILTAERLAQSRPQVRLTVDKDGEAFSAAPLLKAVIQQAPTHPTAAPIDSSSYDLDDGRVSLRAAISAFGWNEKTQLSFTVEGNHVSVYAVNDEGSTLESKQGRCLIPLTIRRRLSIGNNSKVFVITEETPVPHVRIYPNTYLVQILREAEQIK